MLMFGVGMFCLGAGLTSLASWLGRRPSLELNETRLLNIKANNQLDTTRNRLLNAMDLPNVQGRTLEQVTDSACVMLRERLDIDNAAAAVMLGTAQQLVIGGKGWILAREKPVERAVGDFKKAGGTRGHPAKQSTPKRSSLGRKVKS